MSIELDHVKHVTARSFSEGNYKHLKGHERVSVSIRHIPLKSGTELPVGRKKYKIKNDSFLVFVDLHHDSNFAHPVMYELHNTKDGSVTVIEEQFPISDVEIERSLIPYILPNDERRK
jgi:hypothetical protein